MTSPETLRLGCGKDTKPEQWNVDQMSLDGVDEVVDLTATPWPWEDNSWNTIIAEHVFEHLDNLEAVLRECQRVLKPAGTLRTVWPVGYDARADPDHKHVWYWQTPKMFCGYRHWDIDIGLTVEHRSVDLRAIDPTHISRWIHQFLLDLKLTYHGPGAWCFVEPVCSGSFTVIFTNDSN